MQALAEDAAELLPQEQEQKKRGRGRAKKDLRLVDALHQCWQGKSYYERLQEITRQEAEELEKAEAAAAQGPQYRPSQLLSNTSGRTAQDATAAPSSSQLASDAAAAAGADKAALQKLQAAFDAKMEELAAAKDQLKESQELVSKLRAEQRSHPKALQQAEKQRQALERKLEASEKKQAGLERDAEGLQERLGKQEAEKAALQEQLSKSEKEAKALRLKLKQANGRLDKMQAAAAKMQEMAAGMVADAQAGMALD
ncbi:hypothetical protein OEZ86_009805 [Tetradesmus obliquus]|uniref:Uncharacterized protein n=1 Tax=Tetradesmus obliquus TaxID=3088 RepID=A0ABY8UN76_TETOB|nr:hypothetical protein OEZ85_001246 [Tetradesmus obliquus]WIA43306.1 hypothetical protein OEZ86_009805 [Tetradesmus obliquus]